MSARPAVPNTSPLTVHLPSFPASTAGACGDSSLFYSLPSEFCLLLCLLLPFCFQSLPTIKFCNSFVLKTIQIARGVWGVGPIFQFRFSSFQSPAPVRGFFTANGKRSTANRLARLSNFQFRFPRFGFRVSGSVKKECCRRNCRSAASPFP